MMRVPRFHRGVAGILSLALVATTCPSIGFADDAPTAAPTAEELEEARNNFKAGLQLEKDGKYDEALPVFEAVAKVKASAQVRFHIALCHEKLGHLAAAAEAYDAAAKQAEKDGNAPEVLKVAPDLAKKLGDRVPHISFGFVGDVLPDTLTIDGKPVDLGKLKDIAIDPGTHTIVAIKGENEQKSEIKIAEGERKTLRFKVGGTGETAVYTDSAEKVTDKPKDTTPTKKGNPTLVTAGWVLTGVGVASLGASLVFYGIRAGEVRDLNDACTTDYRCPPSAQDSIDKAKTMTTLSRITLGVGVAAAGAGIVMLVLGSGKKTESDQPKGSYARVVPWAPSSQVGLGIEGAF